MAVALNICIIVHVEDIIHWDYPLSANGKAAGLSSLAEVIGTRGAKLSVQFGRNFLDVNDPDVSPNGYHHAGPTLLQTILHRGGNFWTHTHSANQSNLTSNYACVMSAYHNEGGTVAYASGYPGGRSGGHDFDGADWVHSTLLAGMRLMNCGVMKSHARVPLTLRPYGITDDEIEQLHPKGQAPGPIYTDVMTMRQRPFWMDTSSQWFMRSDVINSLDVGSVMMIPAAGKLDLNGLSEGRTAFASAQFTEEDLKWALSQAWAACENSSLQPMIPNVWYTHLPIANIDASAISMMGNFVDSLNDVLWVNSATGQRATWKNMNEIASIFADPSQW